jgi:hypothetical protein
LPGLAKQTSKKTGRVKGQPLLYCLGHNRRKRARYTSVETGLGSPCWIWLLHKDRDGYGMERIGKRTVRAHRIAYEARYGPISDGVGLDHLCRVRACINPNHLEPVSQAENVRRGLTTRLTASDAEAIRASTEAQCVLAGRYGVTQGHISRIQSGQAWRLDPAAAVAAELAQLPDAA